MMPLPPNLTQVLRTTGDTGGAPAVPEGDPFLTVLAEATATPVDGETMPLTADTAPPTDEEVAATPDQEVLAALLPMLDQQRAAQPSIQLLSLPGKPAPTIQPGSAAPQAATPAITTLPVQTDVQAASVGSIPTAGSTNPAPAPASVATLTTDAPVAKIPGGEAPPISPPPAGAKPAPAAKPAGIAAPTQPADKASPPPSIVAEALPTAAKNGAAPKPAAKAGPAPEPGNTAKAPPIMPPPNLTAKPAVRPVADRKTGEATFQTGAAKAIETLSPTAPQPADRALQPGSTPNLQPLTQGPAAAPAQPIATALSAQVLNLARDGAWIDTLARDIAQAASSEGAMRFRLTPETLGELRVEITQGERGAHVRLQVSTEAAQQALAEAQPRLTAEARAQGVRIAETEVSFTGGQAQQQREPGQSHNQNGAAAGQTPRTARGSSDTASIATNTAAASAGRRRTDLYA